MTILGISDYGSFCLAVLVFLALPGPGTVALLTSTAQGGWRAGAAAKARLIAGDQVLLWLAVGGVAALLVSHPHAFKLVQYAGALYLVSLGIRLLFQRQGAPSPIRMAPRHDARQALLITVLNPKAIVFYMAFFPLVINPQTHLGASTFAAMALPIAVITAAYCLTLCFFAGAVSAQLKARRRRANGLRRLAGSFLVAFGPRLSTG